MRRREFIALVGSSVAAWPLAARAQQLAMPVIGFLNPTFIESNADRLRGLHRGLKDAGYVEGENVAVCRSEAIDPQRHRQANFAVTHNTTLW